MRLALALVAAMALMAAPRPSEAVIYPPVINIGLICAPLCVNMTMDFTYTCVGCLYQSGWFPTWTNTSQPAYTLARLPFYERGLHSLAALVLNVPGPATSATSATVYFNARKVYPDLPKNISVWYIDPATGQNKTETRNMGPDLIRRNDNNTGYCYEGKAWLVIDPPCDGHVDPLKNLTFNTPDQLVQAGYSTQRGFAQTYLPYMREYTQQILTDPEAAADSVWYQNQAPWSDTLYFRGMDKDDLAEMKMWFGADWTEEHTAKLMAGKLVKMDMSTWLNNVSVDLKDKMQPGSLTVHERTTNKAGKLVLRTILLLLTDPGQNRNKPTVYTPTKSPSAWCLGMIYARTCVTFHQIRIGHFYTLHMMAAAQHYALLNSIEPGVPQGKATHPIRMLLDEWSDVLIQGSIEFGTYLGVSTPPYVAIKPPTYPQMHNAFVRAGPLNDGEPMDMWGVHPYNLAKRSKLDPKLYTSPGGETWDLYEHMWFATNMFKIVYDYNLKVIKAYYANDAAVRKDKKVANFIEFLQAPTGANLGRVNEHNKVTTREELADVTANIMYKAVNHAVLHLQDFCFKNLNIVFAPTRIDNAILPDPTKTWTQAEFMPLLSGMASAAEQLFQGFNIWMVSPQGGPWIPRIPGTNEPNWEGNLPFPTRGTKGQKANAANVAFRKKFSSWVAGVKGNSFIRDFVTNYNMPFEITTHIDF